MYRNVQLVLGGLVAVFLGLSWLSRRRPDVAWLQAFRLEDHRSEEQKARARRRGHVLAGLEMIGLGLVIPTGYAVLTMMFFQSFSTTTVTILLLVSAAFVALGIRTIARSGRAPRQAASSTPITPTSATRRAPGIAKRSQRP